MWNRLFFPLIICATAGGVYLWQTPQALGQIKSTVTTAIDGSPPPSLFRWTDKNGQIAYGTQPPKGAHAQRVDEKNTSISVVPATKVPVFPVLNEAPSDPRSLGQRAMDRAIDQSTK